MSEDIQGHARYQAVMNKDRHAKLYKFTEKVISKYGGKQALAIREIMYNGMVRMQEMEKAGRVTTDQSEWS